MKTCTKCKETKALNDFWNTRNAKGETVKQSKCKKCKKQYRKHYEKENRKILSEKARLKTQQLKKRLIDTFGSNCVICEKNYHQSCMDFHHIIDNKNERGVAYFLQSSFKAALNEAEKCILVCSNCHRFIHNVGLHIHEYCISQSKVTNLNVLKEYLIKNIKELYSEFSTQTSFNKSKSRISST